MLELLGLAFDDYKSLQDVFIGRNFFNRDGSFHDDFGQIIALIGDKQSKHDVLDALSFLNSIVVFGLKSKPFLDEISSDSPTYFALAYFDSVSYSDNSYELKLQNINGNITILSETLSTISRYSHHKTQHFDFTKSNSLYIQQRTPDEEAERDAAMVRLSRFIAGWRFYPQDESNFNNFLNVVCSETSLTIVSEPSDIGSFTENRYLMSLYRKLVKKQILFTTSNFYFAFYLDPREVFVLTYEDDKTTCKSALNKAIESYTE